MSILGQSSWRWVIATTGKLREFCEGCCKTFIVPFPAFVVATAAQQELVQITPSSRAMMPTRRPATASCFWKLPGICFNGLGGSDLFMSIGECEA
jgi:hypothetical protein